jgi:hypothetical protein
MKSIFTILKNFFGSKRACILLLVTFYLIPLPSFAQEPAWGTQAKADSLSRLYKPKLF